MDMNSKLFHDEETNVVYISPWLKDKKEGHPGVLSASEGRA